mmetsp:Transcript_21124/g.62456  ORF Transcript_21124/g.62456 Transcript_21124/m.62456 type:complete len:218 (+) Transcript_21124:89-742(+)
MVALVCFSKPPAIVGPPTLAEEIERLDKEAQAAFDKFEKKAASIRAMRDAFSREEALQSLPEYQAFLQAQELWHTALELQSSLEQQMNGASVGPGEPEANGSPADFGGREDADATSGSSTIDSIGSIHVAQTGAGVGTSHPLSTSSRSTSRGEVGDGGLLSRLASWASSGRAVAPSISHPGSARGAPGAGVQQRADPLREHANDAHDDLAHADGART